MPEQSLDDQLKVAAIEKTRAEARKIERDADAASRQIRGTAWTEAVKVLGGVILGIGGAMAAITQFEVAELKAKIARQELAEAQRVKSDAEASARAAIETRDAAVRERAENEQAINELKASLARLTSELRSAKPDLIESQLVYVQFQGSIARGLINELRQALQKDAFNAPGAERVAGDYQNLVKYFNERDRPQAERLAKSVEAFFASKKCPLTLRLMPAPAQPLTNPPLEVWLTHSCQQSA